MLEVLLIAFFAVGGGFFLIFLLGVADKKSRAAQKNPTEEGLTQTQFEKACVAVLEGMKLEIENIERTDGRSLSIRAKNPTPFTGGDFLIQCAYRSPQNESDKVSAAEILELSNIIIQERLSKGMFLTNSVFTDDLGSISELAPIEFIDGIKLKELMEKYSIIPAS